MALGESELRRIGDYVRGNLSAWLSDVAPLATVGPQLLERTVRVEEELKNLRETMEVRFDAVDRRFEAQLAVMKAGFDAVDKRFDAVETRFEGRFESVGTRFATIDKQFQAIDKRFDTVDKQFQTVNKRLEMVDKQFQTVDKRFDAHQATMKAQQWIVIAGFVILGTLISILGLAA